ncbi:GAF domain-containing protein [Thermosulfuriphilus sp.]
MVALKVGVLFNRPAQMEFLLLELTGKDIELLFLDPGHLPQGLDLVLLDDPRALTMEDLKGLAPRRLLPLWVLFSKKGPPTGTLRGSMEIIPLDQGKEAILERLRGILALARSIKDLAWQASMFRSLTDQPLVGIYIFNKERYLYVNRAMEFITGYSSKEILKDLRPLDLIHPEDRLLAEKMIRDRFEGKIEAVHYLLRGIKKDGQVIYADIFSRRIDYGPEPAILGALVDVSDKIRIQDQLRRTNRALKVLNLCNQTVIRAKDESQLLREICQLLIKEGGYRLAWIGYARDDEEKTIQPMAKAGDEDGYLERIRLSWGDNPFGQGPTGQAIRTGRPVVNQDILNNPLYAPWRKEAQRRGYASSVALPLVGNGRVFGALNIYASDPFAFDLEETELLESLAKNLAHGIVSLRAKEEQKRARKILETQARQQKAVAELGRLALKVQDLDRLFNEAVRLLVETMEVKYAKVLELLPSGKEFILRSGVGWKEGLVGQARVPAHRGSQAGFTLLSQRPVVVEDFEQEDRFIPPKLLIDHEVRSGLSVIIGPVDRPYGVLGAHCRLKRSFSPDDINFFQAVANILAEAIERQRAKESLLAYTRRLEVLHTMEKMILEARSLEEIATIVLTKVCGLLSASLGSIVYLPRKGGAKLLALYPSKQLSPEDNPLSFFTLGFKDDILAINDLSGLKEKNQFQKWLLSQGICSWVGIGLRVANNLIGYLGLGSKEAHFFSPGRLEIVQEVADILAIAIHQAELNERVRRHAQELEHLVAERTKNLEETASKLREANQELEAFVYSVSHDLRAPLRAMEGFAQALLEDYGSLLDATGQDYARRIVGAAETMDNLIQDLLNYSRLLRQEIRLRRVDLDEILDQVLEQLTPEIEEKKARVDVQRPLGKILGQPSVIVQIMINLLSNALKFVAPGTVPQIKLWTEDLGIFLKLWVEDNGIGIAPEYQEQIFRIFERLHGVETYPGTGIGLAIVKKGAERLGGQVGVVSRIGQGSQFWVTFRKGDQ